MNIHKSDTALVVIDPQNDVLSEKGVSWRLVRDSVKENSTVENIERPRPRRDGASGSSSLLTTSTPRIRRGGSAAPSRR